MNRIKAKAAPPTPLLDAAAPMPEPVARLVEIFQHDLEGVAFPDVSLSALEQAAEVVRERAAEVDALRNRVLVAQAELAASRSELESLAQRGLAYAKVFAASDAELTHKLEKIKLSEPPKRKRRKSAKVPVDSEVIDITAPDEVTPAHTEEPKPAHLSIVG